MRSWWLLLALAAAAQAPPSPSTVADAAGEAVRIDVIATGARGQPVDSLAVSDFELREDGFPQKIDDVRLVKISAEPASATAQPGAITSAADERAEAAAANTRLFGIYLDDYFISRANTDRVRAALHRFVDVDLGPRDLVTIVRPLDSLLTLRLTRDRGALHHAIDAFEGRRGDYEPRTAFERNYIVSERGRADEQRVQTTWSTLNALTLHLANLKAGRSTILFVSEQADPVVRRRGLESLPTSSSVMRTANRSNVSIYALDPRDDADRAASAEEGPNLLRVLADDTDGALLANQSAIEAGLKQMVADASFYYVVTYRSLRSRDGMFHSVVVATKRAGVRIRARNGYWAPTPDEVQRANLMARTNEPRPVRPLEPARRISPLIRPWFGVARGANGKIRVTFVWEPSSGVPGERRARVASRVEFKALGADGTTVFSGVVKPSGSLVVAGDAGTARAVFDVPPGRVEVRMAVEDSAAQTIDSDVRDILVRDLRGSVVLGTPEVLRARTARDLRELEADASAVPVASRDFSRSEQLLIRVPAYAPEGVTPSVSARLVSKAGRVMRELTATPAPAPGGPNQFTVQLASLPTGDYSLEVSAATASGNAKETIAIRVGN